MYPGHLSREKYFLCWTPFKILMECVFGLDLSLKIENKHKPPPPHPQFLFVILQSIISTRTFHHRSNPPWRLKPLICRSVFVWVFRCCCGGRGVEIPIDVVFDIAPTLFYDLNLLGYLSAFAAWRVTNIPHAPNVGPFSHAHLCSETSPIPIHPLPNRINEPIAFCQCHYKPVLNQKTWPKHRCNGWWKISHMYMQLDKFDH